MIKWDESYATGEEKIDSQHKSLFQFINQLHDDLAAERPPSTFEYSLKFLANYAQAHFCYEESCMTRYHCPAARRNKNAHKEFLRFYKSFEIKIKQKGFSSARIAQLHVFIENWIVRHIRKIDKQLKSCIADYAQQRHKL